MIYVFLGDFSFDFSGGEYNNNTVENIYLGAGYYENDDIANADGKKLFDKYIEHNNNSLSSQGKIDIDESYFHFKRI